MGDMETGVLDRVHRRLRRLLEEGSRPEPAYRRLRKLLRQVPEGQRGRGWREASVLVDVHFRQRRSRAAREVRALRSEAGGAGAPERAEFERLLEAHAAPLQMGPHGIGTLLADIESRRAWPQVAAAITVLESRGHPCFAVSGTLLGLVRDGDLLPHDDDVDLAVLLDATTHEAAVEEWLRLRAQLLGEGVLDEEFERRGLLHTRLRPLDKEVPVDLFPAWTHGDELYIWPSCRGSARLDDLVPLGSRQAAEVPIPVPRDPELLLDANYGPGWRTPDPEWSFDWPAAHEEFSAFCAPLKARLQQGRPGRTQPTARPSGQPV